MYVLIQGNGFASAADFTICAWFLIYYVVNTILCIIILCFNFLNCKWFQYLLMRRAYTFWYIYVHMTYPDDNIPQRKPNPLFSYCLPREGKAPTCTSFSNLQIFQDPQDFLIFRDHLIASIVILVIGQIVILKKISTSSAMIISISTSMMSIS